MTDRPLLAPEVRDLGLLESALARPRASASGADVYVTVDEQAAALHSLARHHPLVDGNEPLALGATRAFLGLTGRALALTQEEAYTLVMAVAAGELDDVAPIADVLCRGSRRR